MASFKNTKLSCSFELPDNLTVREQLAFFSEAEPSSSPSFLEGMWKASMGVIKKWECELLPDPKKADFGKLTDPRIAQLAIWVGTEVMNHVTSITTPSPN